MIAGLYRYVRGGKVPDRWVTPDEICLSLKVNPWYRERLLVLAGDHESAEVLRGSGLRVHRVFDDAPEPVQRDKAHTMKHWMCRWALAEFGEFLWVDWDTVCLRKPDNEFWAWCRRHGTPKFLKIPSYWATVNCGIYYASTTWGEAMNRSFKAVVSQPNDELLWRSVLPAGVLEREEFWWNGRVVLVERDQDVTLVGQETYFVHGNVLKTRRSQRSRNLGIEPISTTQGCRILRGRCSGSTSVMLLGADVSQIVVALKLH